MLTAATRTNARNRLKGIAARRQRRDRSVDFLRIGPKVVGNDAKNDDMEIKMVLLLHDLAQPTKRARLIKKEGEDRQEAHEEEEVPEPLRRSRRCTTRRWGKRLGTR